MNILFMCVANSARSQMAEGLAKNLFPYCKFQSAGSKPRVINSFAIEVMKEISIDIKNQYSKSVSDLEPTFIKNLNYVITLCAEEVCPSILSNAKKLHWPCPDPALQGNVTPNELMIRFREAREIIFNKLIENKTMFDISL